MIDNMLARSQTEKHRLCPGQAGVPTPGISVSWFRVGRSFPGAEGRIWAFSVAQFWGCSPSRPLSMLMVLLSTWWVGSSHSTEYRSHQGPLIAAGHSRSLSKIWQVVTSSSLLLEGQCADARCPAGLGLYLLTSALTPVFPMNDPDDRPWTQPPLATGLQMWEPHRHRAKAFRYVLLHCGPYWVASRWDSL